MATKLSSTIHFISAQMAPWRMSGNGLLQTRQWNFGFYKMQTISTLTERLLSSQRGLCLLLLLLLLLAAVELSLGGSSPYTSTDKTNEIIYNL